MRTLSAVGLIVLLIVGIAFAANTITKKAGEYGVEVTMDKNPPVMGKNNVDIRVTDKAGKAVTDARVAIEYSMPGMAGMPPMNYKTAAGLKGDTYSAVIEPSMAGSWNVAVKVSRGGKTDTAKFTMDVK